VKRDQLRRHVPLLASAGVFLALLAITIVLIQRHNGGRFVYSLDDAYIHLAVAKHFAQDGVWGVTRFAFTNATSSPLWTLAISGVFALAGPSEWVPLALNIAIALGILFFFHWIALRERIPAWIESIGLIALVLLEPAVPMTISGMEHLAQLLADLALVYAVGRVLAGGVAVRRSWPGIVSIGLLAAAVTGLRYEGWWLAGTAVIFLAARRAWAPSAAALVGGSIPPLAYGAVSLSHGWFFLPASLLMKANTAALQPGISLLSRLEAQLSWAASNVARSPHLPVLIALLAGLALALGLRRKPGWRARVVAFWCVLLVIPPAVLHLTVGSVGYFFRYDAYLAGLSIAALTLALPRLIESLGERPRRWMALPAALGLLCIAVLAPRGFRATVLTVTASGNIHDQQIQMASFVRTYYDGAVIVANDIGAIDYFADIHVVDPAGLGDLTAARFLVRGNREDAAGALDRLARSRQASFAMVYRSWLDEYRAVPASWRELGRWTIEDNFVCGDDVVTFFGIDERGDDTLLAALRSQSALLPPRAHATIGPPGR
jgi:hypothetical protein